MREYFFESGEERTRKMALKMRGIEKVSYIPRFNTHRFTNVFRRFDKTTQTIIDLCTGTGKGNKLRNIAAARFLSNNDTILRIYNAGIFNIHNDEAFYSELTDFLVSLKEKGLPIYTSAFMRTNALYDFPSNAYLPSFCAKNMVRIFKDYVFSTYEAAFYRLQLLPNVGTFMAYEYVKDFSYFSELLADAPDKLTWAHFGLGSEKGIKVIAPNLDKSQYVPFSMGLLEEWQNRNRDNALTMYFKDLQLSDVEHWLCEFYKLTRDTPPKQIYRSR